MKSILSAILFFLCIVQVPAQVTTGQDSLFFLEKYTLNFGKKLDRWKKDRTICASCGFIWRLGTGLTSSYSGDLAAATQFSLEAGYKFHFAEITFKHWQTGPAVGADQSSLLPARIPGTLYAYRIPYVFGVSANYFNLGIHIPLAKMPISVHYGKGWLNKYDYSGTVQDYYLDGSKAWSSTRAGTAQHMASSVLSLQASHGIFWGKVSRYYTRQKNNGVKYEDPRHNFIALEGGIQMSTGKDPKMKALKSHHKPRPGRFVVGFSSQISTIAGRETAAHRANAFEFGINFNRIYSVLFTTEFQQFRSGIRKILPGIENNPIFSPTYYVWDPDYLSTLRFSRILTPDAVVQWSVNGGAAYFRRVFGSWGVFYDEKQTSRSKEFGLTAGVDLRIRFVHTGLSLVRNLDSNGPVFLQWNTGIRLNFYQ